MSYLGVSFDDLMSEPVPSGKQSDTKPAALPHRLPDRPVQHAADNPVLEMENGVRWERLAPHHGDAVDPLLVTYQPGAASSVESKMTQHNGTEYAYLLSGHLTLKLDFESFDINPGDSWSFDSVRPHMYENHGTHPAQGLWFVVGRPRTMSPIHQAPDGKTMKLNSAVDVLRAMDRLA